MRSTPASTCFRGAKDRCCTRAGACARARVTAPNCAVATVTAVAPRRLRLLRLKGTNASTLLVWVKDVVLRLHGQVARVPAVGDTGGIDRLLVGLGVVVEQRVAPSA